MEKQGAAGMPQMMTPFMVRSSARHDILKYTGHKLNGESHRKKKETQPPEGTPYFPSAAESSEI